MLALLFGVLSSAGPCFVTRLVVVSNLARSTRRSTFVVLGTFLLGLFAVYVTFAFVADVVFAVLAEFQTFILLGLGIAFAVAGVVTLVRWHPDHHHDHVLCEGSQTHAPSGATLASVAAIGAASALNISPCCAPWLIMAVTLTSSQHNPVYGAALLLVFSIGHAASLLIYGRLAHDLGSIAKRLRLETWVPALNCALLFLVAIYYVVQA